MPDPPSDNSEWSCKRHEVAYQEARCVLEAQQDTLADIDDKAIQTVHFAILLAAIVVSARRYGDEVGISLHPELAALGGVLLISAIGIGMVTYSESDLYLGAGSDYLVQLKNGSFNENDGEDVPWEDHPLSVGGEYHSSDDVSWEDHLIVQCKGWTTENANDIRFNGVLLSLTQALLFLGIVCAVFAIVL